MVRLIRLTLLLGCFVVPSAFAQQNSNTQTNATMSGGSSNAQQQTSSLSANGTDADNAALDLRYEEIANLGQSIELANKKIERMQLMLKLNELTQLQQQESIGYQVIRIEGFDEKLYAILQSDNGSVYQVSPGEMVDDDYRVTLISPNGAKVINVNTRKVSTVPFLVEEFNPDLKTGSAKGSQTNSANNRSNQSAVVTAPTSGATSANNAATQSTAKQG
jgi:hypothetical protein